MCLITKQKRPSVAKHDIIVYKVVKGDLKAWMHDFKYKLGVLYFTAMEEDRNFSFLDMRDNIKIRNLIPDSCKFNDMRKEGPKIGLRSFGPGFHSASNDKRLTVKPEYKEILVECTIPRGSLYYKGFTGLIISNAIILNRIIR